MMQRNIQLLIKRIPFALILLIGIMVLAACGNQATQQPAAAPAPTENGSTDTEMTDSPEATESTPADEGTESEEADNMGAAEGSEATTSTKGTTETAAGEGTMATQVGEGTFSGLADAHSAEVMVKGTPVVYQLDTAVQSEAAKLQEGDEITFKYTEKAIPGDASTMVGIIIELKKK